MKKSIRMLIIAVIVLAVLGGGYYFAVKWKPKSDKKDTQKTEPASKVENLVDLKAEDVESIAIHNVDINYTLVNGDPIKLQGYESSLISQSQLSSAFDSALNIFVSHSINKKVDDLSEYGLTSKNKTVTFNLKNGSKIELVIGDDAYIDNECYAMIDGTDKVVTISSSVAQMLLKNPETFRESQIITIDNQSITKFVLSKGKDTILAFDMKEEKNDKEKDKQNTQQMTEYIISYPYKGVKASLDRISELFEKLTSPGVNSIAEENPKDLKKYGLDNPMILKIKDSQGEKTIYLGNATEYGVYMMCDDSKVVYDASCDFYKTLSELDPQNFVDSFIHLINIVDVESIDIEKADKKYTMSIKGDTDKDNATYKVNNKKVSTEDFKTLYQAVIGVTSASVQNTEPSGNVYMKIKFNLKDKTQKTFTYYNHDERYSIVKADNGLVSLVLSKKLDNIITQVKKITK